MEIVPQPPITSRLTNLIDWRYSRCVLCRKPIDVIWEPDDTTVKEHEELDLLHRRHCPECIGALVTDITQQDAWLRQAEWLRLVRGELNVREETLWARKFHYERRGKTKNGPEDPYGIQYGVHGLIMGEVIETADDIRRYSKHPEFVSTFVGEREGTPFSVVRLVIGYDIIHPLVTSGAEICLRWNPRYPQEPPELAVRNWSRMSAAERLLLMTDGMKVLEFVDEGGRPRLTPTECRRLLQNYANTWNKAHQMPPDRIETFCDLVALNMRDPEHDALTPAQMRKRIKTAGVGRWKDFKSLYLTAPDSHLH